MNLVINQHTETKLRSIQADLPHAILLTGKPGVGLATIAKSLAGKRLVRVIEPTDSKDEINHETGTISVEIIRNLYEQTRTKHVGQEVILLDDADRMSRGAQAAFLKLLEEPAENIHFILTSHSPQTLVATIRSRVQSIEVEPISKQQTAAFIASLGLHSAKKQTQLEYLGEGLPSELHRLTNSEEYFAARAEIMGDVRTLLSGSVYSKLLLVQKYYQKKHETLQLLDGSLAVSRRSLSSQPQTNLIMQIDNLITVREKIDANCNIRLQLMAFVL